MTRSLGLSKIIRAVFLAAVAIGICGFAPSEAQAFSRTQIVGGPGGQPFAEAAAADASVVGLAVSSGALVDAVAVVYYRADGSRLASPKRGGLGGGPGAFVFNDRESLIAMTVWAGQVVQALQFHTNMRSSRIYGEPASARPVRIEIPQGHRMVGLVGRAGLYLDAIGLLYAPSQSGNAVVQGTSGAAPQAPAPSPNTAPRPHPPAQAGSNPGVEVRRSRSTFTSLELTVRMKNPVVLTLNFGLRPLGNSECFRGSERFEQRSLEAKAEQKLMFSGLKPGTPYSYSVILGNGRCVSGSEWTAQCIDSC